MSPHDHLATRLIGIALLAGFGVVAVVLLWADRGAALGDRALDSLAALARRAEHAIGIDVVDRRRIPFSAERLGHVALWAAGTVIVGSVRLRRRSVTWIAAEVALVSMVFELAQPFVSTSRTFEPADAQANLIGVLVGSVALTCLLVVGHAASALGARDRVSSE